MRSYRFRTDLRWMLLFGCLLLVLTAGPAAAQIRFPPPVYNTGYTLTDLGASNSWGWSFAYAINNAGRVVGDMTKSSGELRAFRTLANQPINQAGDDLGVLLGNYRSYAYAINNGGVVVGNSVRNYPYIQTRAISVGQSGNGLEDLHTLSSATNTYAQGNNDYGWITGYYTTGTATNPISHSMITFGPGWTQSIDSWYGYPAQSATYDVNNLSQFVGWRSPLAYHPPRAFMFDAAANAMRMIDIGTLQGGATSKAYAINEAAQVVGESQKVIGNQFWNHAFLFKDANNNGIVDAGEMKDLDTMNSSQSGAMSINNGGTAVGYYGGSSSIIYGGSRAAIFSNGSMTDLNSMVQGGTGSWTLRVAYGINDNGQIVGFMEDNNTDNQARVRHAFRLDPAPVRLFIPFP